MANKDYQKRYMAKKPWYKSYNKAMGRCMPGGKYYIRGIKFLMTVDDFKYLWFRDKAHNLKRPSIDRINGNGHYEISNCRYIELLENTKRPQHDTQLMLDNWDKTKTLKESSIIFNRSYDAIQQMSFKYKLEYRRER